MITTQLAHIKRGKTERKRILLSYNNYKSFFLQFLFFCFFFIIFDYFIFQFRARVESEIFNSDCVPTFFFFLAFQVQTQDIEYRPTRRPSNPSHTHILKGPVTLADPFAADYHLFLVFFFTLFISCMF